MWGTIIGVIWAVIKSIFTKKDPEIKRLEKQNEADRKQAIDMQRKPTGTVGDAIKRLPE